MYFFSILLPKCICLYLCLFVYIYQCVMFVCTKYMFIYLSTNQYGFVHDRLPMYVCLFKSTYQYFSVSILFVGLYMFVCLSICLFVYILISLWFCLSAYVRLSICLQTNMSMYMFVCLYVCLFVYISICLCMCLSDCLFVYISDGNPSPPGV